MSKWRDSIRIVRHLTAFRIWNVLLLRISFLSTRIFSRPIHLGLPASMSIEPTTACNLGCPECPSGLKQFTRPTGKLDLDLHRKLLKQIDRSVFYINYYFPRRAFFTPEFSRINKGRKALQDLYINLNEWSLYYT